jgi:hypothetical protein
LPQIEPLPPPHLLRIEPPPPCLLRRVDLLPPPSPRAAATTVALRAAVFVGGGKIGAVPSWLIRSSSCRAGEEMAAEGKRGAWEGSDVVEEDILRLRRQWRIPPSTEVECWAPGDEVEPPP